MWPKASSFPRYSLSQDYVHYYRQLLAQGNVLYLVFTSEAENMFFCSPLYCYNVNLRSIKKCVFVSACICASAWEFTAGAKCGNLLNLVKNVRCFFPAILCWVSACQIKHWAVLTTSYSYELGWLKVSKIPCKGLCHQVHHWGRCIRAEIRFNT